MSEKKAPKKTPPPKPPTGRLVKGHQPDIQKGGKSKPSKGE